MPSPAGRKTGDGQLAVSPHCSVILRTPARLAPGCSATHRPAVPDGIVQRERFKPGNFPIGPSPHFRQDDPCPLLPSVSPRHWPVPLRPPATPSPLRCSSGPFPPCCKVAT